MSGYYMTDGGKKTDMSPLVKPNVNSSALKLQMRIWCYREVSVLASKNLTSDEFLDVSLRLYLAYIYTCCALRHHYIYRICFSASQP